MGAEITGRFVSVRLPMGGCRWGEGVGVKIDEGRKGAEDTRDFLITGRDVLLGKIIERQGLCEREDLCRPIIPLERFGNGVRTGFDAIVPILRSGPRVALSSDDRAENAQTRHACHITNNVVQVQMHLIQRLVHVLNMFDRHLEQIVAMAEETAELADVLRRTKRRRQQPIAMQPLQPSTIETIRFRTARDILDVACIDEGDRKPAGLKNLKQRNPVHPSGFHGDGSDTTGFQPVGQTMQVTGKGATFLDRLGIAICGHTDPMLLSTHIDAGGMRMDERHILGKGRGFLAFFGHTFLQSGAEREEQGQTGSLGHKDTMGGDAAQRGETVSS